MTLSTSAKVAPAASRIAPMFSSVARAWAATSSPPTSFPSESSGPHPEMKSRSPNRVASV